MEDISCAPSYQAEGPYPEIRVEGRNRQYGQTILSNVGGGVSEMGAVARYLYSGFTQEGRPEVAECLERIAMVEMHHLSIFSQLARQLGEDPRLWAPFRGRRRYWTPEYLRYPQGLEQILRYSIEEEKATVQKYRQQALWIKDMNVAANLLRIIEDEELHIKVLTGLLESYYPVR
ncbi:MAG: rubrerythrin family protein [Oscillospiraceae bacterium]|jgi:bacterioferritin|nr:rubrerythrin family protein [Oscillospiraceae bacterium]